MIRRMQRADIDRVANILLDTNIRAHNSILIKRTTTYQKISSCTSFGSLHDKLEAYTQKIKERKYLYHKKYTLFYIIIKISPSFQKRMTEIFCPAYSCSNQSAIS